MKEEIIKKIKEDFANINSIKVIQKNMSSFTILIVSDVFINKSNIIRHQSVYKSLKKFFIEKKIHALSIYTYSSEEWKKIRKSKKLKI